MGDSVDIGLIGCGLIAQLSHLPHLLDDPTARVRFVCDQDPARLRLASEQVPAAQATTDYEDVLASDVEAVLITTHDLGHRSLVLDALAAGKHVFVEKPLALAAAHAEEVAERAAATGRYVAVGYQRAHDPALPRLADLLGELGEVGLVHMHDVCHDNDLVVGEIVGDRLGSESFRKGRSDFGDREAWRRLGTSLFGELPDALLDTYRLVHNLACHDLAVLIALLGEPLSVEFAEFWPAHYGIVVWRFAEARCVLEIGQTARKWFDQQLVVYGSEATLKASWPSPFVVGTPTTVELRRMRGTSEESVAERGSHRSSFRAELKDFVDRVRERRFDDRSLSQSVAVCRWLERALLWHAELTR
jgi:predicted dehydrogenase